MPQFLDLFTYECIEEGDNGKSFINCIMLKSIGKFKSGDNIKAINIQISLYMFANDNDFEEEHIIL